LVAGLALAAGKAHAEDDIRQLKLRDWEPRSMLVTKTTLVETPRFPVVDIHNHLGGGKDFLTSRRVERYLSEMDAAGVRTVVNLDGGWDKQLEETIAALDQAHPGRFLTFALVNFDGIDDDGWTDREVRRLEESFHAGARGLKIDKRLGLIWRYKNGKVMPVDDPKLDRIWETCGRHKRPVVIHVSDPSAFFTPLDRFNERWHELNEHPNWLFFDDRFPRQEETLDQLHRVIARHPETTFVNTHFGNHAEDLASVADKLDRYPNMYVDIDARISELGRQPYTARRFFLKYQDRILFGTDTPPNRDAFRIYYRFLETDDEYFDCAASHHRQGFWMIYGLFLPDEVLEKIYFKNAQRVLGLAAADASQTAKTEDKEARRQGEGKKERGADQPVLRVKATQDFEVTGDGKNEAWGKTEWVTIPQRTKEGLPYESRMKVLYSPTGLYFLLHGTDKKLSAKIDKDVENLWEEDVFEVFLWTDESETTYFEYEISPLNFELPILVPNFAGTFLGWLPWHYEGGRKTRKATAVSGGAKKADSAISGWTAEVFIPYALLAPLKNVPPKAGTKWRANFYRMDYDDGKTTRWTWAPVGPSFHEFRKFGTLVFE
jgi:predicted TIM-barrel fold metal-dependent hydrolase